MIVNIGNNIISPLGFTSQATYDAVRAGKRAGHSYDHLWGLQEPCFVSLLNNEEVEYQFSSLSHPFHQRYTRFEKIAILSVSRALSIAGIDPTSPDVLFVLSTTKGNVELLDNIDDFEPERVCLWRSAQLLGEYFGTWEVPLVVSNACISGVVAQLVAFDYLQHKRYKYAVVVGAEVLSRFIISGFQSFKALSPTLCQPFDRDRRGLNLGEAAATIVYQRLDDNATSTIPTFAYIGGAVSNDANHISGPSRIGEGLYNAIQRASRHLDGSSLAFINAHGTATRYNDDMESFAVSRSGLQTVPINSLKGYLGHTLGTAGVLETILSSYALADGVVLPTEGYRTFGVVNDINIASSTLSCESSLFMKLISGFGGSNAAVIFKYINH